MPVRAASEKNDPFHLGLPLGGMTKPPDLQAGHTGGSWEVGTEPQFPNPKHKGPGDGSVHGAARKPWGCQVKCHLLPETFPRHGDQRAGWSRARSLSARYGQKGRSWVGLLGSWALVTGNGPLRKHREPCPWLLGCGVVSVPDEGAPTTCPRDHLSPALSLFTIPSGCSGVLAPLPVTGVEPPCPPLLQTRALPRCGLTQSHSPGQVALATLMSQVRQVRPER